MDYMLIYFAVIAFSIIVTIGFLIYKSVLQSDIQKKYLNKEKRIEYEQQLEKSKIKYDIKDTDSVFEIANKIGLVIEECEPQKIENGYDGRIINKRIKIIKNLSIRQKNWVVAHEIAHYLRNPNSDLVAGCKTKSIFVRTKDEQICDYMASIILLPYNELKARMEQARYNCIGKSLRMQFISELADEKNIPISVVVQLITNIKNA